MLKDFKSFLTRGNVVDLAVAVVIGVAFGTVVASLVENILTPIVAIPGSVNFDDLALTVGGGTIRYGRFLNDVITFVSVAAAVFFFVVRPMAALRVRQQRGEPDVPATKDCTDCLSTIPAAARRCAFCTSEQATPAVGPPPDLAP